MRFMPHLVVAALVPLAGCAEEAVCPPPVARAEARVVAGIYDALGALGEKEDVEVTELGRVHAGFSFEPPNRGPGWELAMLELVQWWPERGVSQARILLRPTMNGIAEVEAPRGFAPDEAVLRERFDAFVGNVTTADTSMREGWFAAFLDSRDEQGDRRFLLEGASLRLQSVYDSLVEVHEVEPDESAGRVLHVGLWSFWFRFPARSVGTSVGGDDLPYVHVQADARGSTLLRVVGVDSGEDAVQVVTGVFQAWGLGDAPWSPEAFEVEGTQCGTLRGEVEVLDTGGHGPEG